MDGAEWAEGRWWRGQEDMEEEGWNQVTAVTGQLRSSARKEGAERKRRRRVPFQEGWAGAEPLSENPDSGTGQGWRDRKGEVRAATREQ